MVDRDFLARIDAQMERGNQHMERGNQHMERGNVLMEEVRDDVRLTRELVADNRVFRQQMIARVDRMTRDNARMMDGMADELRRMNDELERRGAERREESRAEREALLAVIDRMDRLDPPSAAA